MDSIPLIRRIASFSATKPKQILELSYISTSWRDALDEYFGAEMIFRNFLAQKQNQDATTTTLTIEGRQMISHFLTRIIATAHYRDKKKNTTTTTALALQQQKEPSWETWIWKHAVRAGFSLADCNEYGQAKEPMLHTAVHLISNVKMVEAMLHASGFVEAKNDNDNSEQESLVCEDAKGRSLIAVAIERGAVDLVELLVRVGRIDLSDSLPGSTDDYPMAEVGQAVREEFTSLRRFPNDPHNPSTTSPRLERLYETATVLLQRYNVKTRIDCPCARLSPSSSVTSSTTPIRCRPMEFFIHSGNTKIVSLFLLKEERELNQAIEEGIQQRSLDHEDYVPKSTRIFVAAPTFAKLDSSSSGDESVLALSAKNSGAFGSDILRLILENLKKYYSPEQVEYREKVLFEQYNIRLGSSGISSLAQMVNHENVSANVSDSVRPIFAAARSGNVDAIRMLIDAGATCATCASPVLDEKEKEEEGTTPTVTTPANHVLFHIDYRYHIDPLYTVFVRSAEETSKVIKYLIKEVGVNPEVASESVHRTPVGLAVAHGDSSALRALLECGADPNRPSEAFLAAPLFIAISKGRAECVRILLEFGADPFVREPLQSPSSSSFGLFSRQSPPWTAKEFARQERYFMIAADLAKAEKAWAKAKEKKEVKK